MAFLITYNKIQIMTYFSLLTLFIISSTYVFDMWLFVTKKILSVLGFPVMVSTCGILAVYSLFKPWGLLDNCLFFYRFHKKHASKLESYNVFKEVRKHLLKELDKLIQFTDGRNLANVINLMDLPDDFKLKYNFGEGVTLYEILKSLRSRLVDGYEKIPLGKLREVHLHLKFKKVKRNAEKVKISNVILETLHEDSSETSRASLPTVATESTIQERNLLEEVQPEGEQLAMEMSNQRTFEENASDDEIKIFRRQRSFIALLKLLAQESAPTNHGFTREEMDEDDHQIDALAHAEPVENMFPIDESSTPEGTGRRESFFALLELMSRLAEKRKRHREMRRIKRRRRQIYELENSEDREKTRLIEQLNEVQSRCSLRHSVADLLNKARGEQGPSGDGLNTLERRPLDNECRLQKRRSVKSLRELLANSPVEEHSGIIDNEKERLIKELAKSAKRNERHLAAQLAKRGVVFESRSTDQLSDREGLEELSYDGLRNIDKKRVCRSLINILRYTNREITDFHRKEKRRLADELAKSEILEERHLAEQLRKFEPVFKEGAGNDITIITRVQENESTSGELSLRGENSSQSGNDTANNADRENGSNATTSEPVRRRTATCALEYSPVSKNKEIDQVEWPATNKLNLIVVSKPLCLDSKKQLLRRNCTANGWNPKLVQCVFAQYSYSDSNKCPKYYTPFDAPHDHHWPLMCIRVVDPAEWQNSCLESGSTKYIMDFDEETTHKIISKLLDDGIREFWTPMRKWDKYASVDFTLPGPKWRTSPNVFIKDDDVNLCVSYNLENNSFQMTDCKKSLHNVCFFNEPSVVGVIYPEKYFTTRYSDRQDKLFSVEQIEQSSWDEVSDMNYCRTPQIESAEHNYIYERIMYKSENNYCWMGLSRKTSGNEEPQLDQLQWTTGSKEVDFVNWHKYVSFNGSSGIFVHHMKPCLECESCWDLVEKKSRHGCILCETFMSEPNTQLSLDFRPSLHRLELTVYSPEGLWRHNVEHPGVNCFTDAGQSLSNSVALSLRMSTVTETPTANGPEVMFKRIYKLMLLEEGAGRYWCEAHKMRSFILIETNRVYAYDSLSLKTYAMLVDLQVKEQEEHLENATKNALEDAFKDYSANMTNIRLMKITNVINSNVTVLAHFDLNATVAESDNDLFDTVVGIDKQTRELISEIKKTNDIVNSYNHTTYCIPMNTSLHSWNSLAKLDEAIVPLKICLQENGLPIFMRCTGDNLFGGILIDKLMCDTNVPISETTEQLYSDSNTKNYHEYDKILKNVSALIADYEKFRAVDIHSIGKIMNNAANYKSANETELDQIKLDELTSIISKVLKTPYDVTSLSQIHLNATNLILDATDLFLTEIINYEDNVDIEFNCTKPFVAIHVVRPFLSDNAGIAVTRKLSGDASDLEDFEITFLQSEINITEIVQIENLEAAVWLTRNVLDNLTVTNFNSNRSRLAVVFKVMYRNNLFAPDDPPVMTSGIPVVSVMIPGYDSNLLEPISIIFKQNSSSSDSKCAFWKFYQPGEGKYGNWSDVGCFTRQTLKNGSFILCHCYHMTHYSQMMEINPVEIAEIHKRILNLITLIGCAFSLLGIFLIMLTAVSFRAFREKAGTKVLIQLSIAISLQMFVLIFLNILPLQVTKTNMNERVRDKILCVAVGSILQYSLLSSFAWMVVVAVLQYRRYVTVLGSMRPNHFLLKSTLFGWVLPLFIVIVTLSVNFKTYIPDSTSNSICYPTDWELYFGILLPIVLMILVNLGIFLIICYNVLKMKHLIKNKSKDPDLIYAQLKLSIFLFFLLGLNWLFGLLQMFTTSLIIRYLFSITSTMQGFILFIYFVVLDTSTRKLWKDSMNKIFV